MLGGAARDNDTICALATAVGTAGIAVVRLSGKEALAIGRKVAPFLPKEVESHRLYFGGLQSYPENLVFDEALVSFFAQGKSYTGEETLEFSIHGSNVLADLLLRSLVHAGARPADRGEFTYRSFMHGNLDLVQAESVLALIESQTELSAKQALRQLQGGLSDELAFCESEVTWSLAHLEAGIDFSMEGLQTVSDQELLQRLGKIQQELREKRDSYKAGKILNEGLKLVLMGEPNVGKSSLLNLIVQDERAIVTEFAGTTRDLVEASVVLDGIKLQFVDTAGLRQTSDLIEQMGIAKTKQALQEADLVLFVFDSSKGLNTEELHQLAQLGAKDVILIGNKKDLMVVKQGQWQLELLSKLQKIRVIPAERVKFVSALDTSGARNEILHALRDWLKQMSFENSSLLFKSRHFERICKAEACLAEGIRLIQTGLSPELAAIELKESLLAIQETLGKHFDDQVLDRVFKEFCIGK